MIKKLASVLAASLTAALLAAPASAGDVKLGLLTCEIDGGTGLIIASHKGLVLHVQVFAADGSREYYTGIISKIGVDLGVTHQGLAPVGSACAGQQVR